MTSLKSAFTCPKSATRFYRCAFRPFAPGALDPALAPGFKAVGAYDWTAGSKDAAIVLTLNPGPYTAQVVGKNGATGVALIEVYEAN